MTATPQAAPGTGVGFALSPNRLGRYLAAAGGLLALVLFYLPWVAASLPGIGEVSLSGVEMARGAAITRVNQAAVDASRNPGAGGAPAAGAPATGASGASGGLTLPTRVPTVASGASGAGGGLTLPTRVPTVAAGSAPATGAAPAASGAGAAGAAGGPALPTRVPTVAPGGAPAGFGSSAGVAQAQPGASAPAPAAPAPAPRPAAPVPDVLPQFLLYLVPLAGLGIFAFSLIWERLVDRRDRFAGRLWTLLLAYGGLLLTGYVLYKAAIAQPGNVLLGAGAVVGPAPALWGVFLAFLFSAACLTVAWLSPAPLPPDPYWRARAPTPA
jgi:hypothetical protein